MEKVCSVIDVLYIESDYLRLYSLLYFYVSLTKQKMYLNFVTKTQVPLKLYTSIESGTFNIEPYKKYTRNESFKQKESTSTKSSSK